MLYGTVKTVDEAGRIVLPKEYRNKMNISVGTKVVLYENDGKLTIEVVTPKCKLCGAAENVNEELSLCEKCIKKVKIRRSLRFSGKSSAAASDGVGFIAKE